MPNSIILKTITLNDGTYNNTLPLEDTTARNNITTLANSLAAVATSGSYNDLDNKPTLGTAAALDVASSGDASTTQVVKGDDSRLTDARTPTSHTHTVSQITDFPTIPEGALYCTFTFDSGSTTDGTLNKTTTEILVAANAGMVVICDVAGYTNLGIYVLMNKSALQFGRVKAGGSGTSAEFIEYNSKNSNWYYFKRNIQNELTSGTTIKTVNNTSLLGSGNIDTHELPSQTGNSGKFLTTNGSVVSWEHVPAEFFICIFTADVQGETISCDKSISEIKDAFNAGKHVIGIGDFANVFHIQDFHLITELTGVSSINQMALTFSSTTDLLFAGLCVMYIKGGINENDEDEWEIGYLFDADDKEKLESVEWNAEPNVQSDWNETDTDSDAYILNKPTIPDAVSGTNDGTNWTSLTIGSTTKAIPSGGNATLSGLTDTTIASPFDGQVLKYNNSSSKWENANETKELPSVTGNASKVLAVNSGATGVEWVTAPAGLPSQTGNQGKFLATDGLSAYWTYFGHDISHTTNTSVTTSTTVTFVANKRCSQMVSTAADLAVTFEVNNDADNYLWVKNTGSSEIDITISGVSYNNSSVTNVYMPSDGISIPAGKVCEIGVVCNDDGAFITSRSDLSL